MPGGLTGLAGSRPRRNRHGFLDEPTIGPEGQANVFGFREGIPASQALVPLAIRQETLENQRFQGALSGLVDAEREAHASLSEDIDTNLLFGRAADAVGGQTRQGLDAIRRSLGARGLSAGSGAATGLLQRLLFQRDAALTGAKRDTAIFNQQNRQARAAQKFANALNLADFRDRPVPSAIMDAAVNAAAIDLAREGLASQERSTRRAGRNQLLSGLFGAIPIIGNFLGG